MCHLIVPCNDATLAKPCDELQADIDIDIDIGIELHIVDADEYS